MPLSPTDTHAAVKSGNTYFVTAINTLPQTVTVLGRGNLTECARLAENTARTDAQLYGLSAYVTLIGQNTWQIAESDWK